MIKVAIVDDDPVALKLTRDLMLKSKIDTGLDISLFLSGERFLDQADRFDLLLLDIDMPGISGLDVVEHLIDAPIVVIYLTSHLEYMEKAFNMNVFRFVYKQDIQLKLPEILRSAIDRIVKRHDVIWKSNDGICGFRYRDIICIELSNRKCLCFTRSGKTELINQKLSNILSSLDDWFVQINRSQIINMRYITSINRTFIQLYADDRKYPISRGRHKSVVKKYTLRMLCDE